MPLRPHLVVATEALARRLEILSGYELARELGRPYGTGGYTGLPARLDDGTFAPPGQGECLRAVRAVELDDGTWALPLHQTLVESLGGNGSLVMSTIAGRTVATRTGDETLPTSQDVNTDRYVDPEQRPQR